MFVRTWLKLKQVLRGKDPMAMLITWIFELIKKMITFRVGGDGQTFVESDMWPISLD